MATTEKKKKKLTNKEQVFIEDYIRHWNAAGAARAAGYSAKTARQIGYEYLTKPYIQEAIDERLATIRMQTNEIYARLTAQARADMSEFIEFVEEPVLDREGNEVGTKQVVHVKQEVFERYGFLVKSISPAAGGGFKVELYSAQTALELMGKTYSLFADRDEKGNIIPATVNIYIPGNDRA